MEVVDTMLHMVTNIFVVSPNVTSTGDLTLPLLTAAAKWVLILVLIA
jgi:hypothetical protein